MDEGTEVQSKVAAYYRSLATELTEVAATISALAMGILPDNRPDSASSQNSTEVAKFRIGPSRSELRQWTADEYKRRRARSDIFGHEDFREPAWDIMLDLFIHHLDGKSIRTTSVCIAACVPPTTAMRWLAVLESRGLIERSADDDARATLVELSQLGAAKMSAHVSAMIGK